MRANDVPPQRRFHRQLKYQPTLASIPSDEPLATGVLPSSPPSSRATRITRTRRLSRSNSVSFKSSPAIVSSAPFELNVWGKLTELENYTNMYWSEHPRVVAAIRDLRQRTYGNPPRRTHNFDRSAGQISSSVPTVECIPEAEEDDQDEPGTDDEERLFMTLIIPRASYFQKVSEMVHEGIITFDLEAFEYEIRHNPAFGIWVEPYDPTGPLYTSLSLHQWPFPKEDLLPGTTFRCEVGGCGDSEILMNYDEVGFHLEAMHIGKEMMRPPPEEPPKLRSRAVARTTSVFF